MTGSGGVELSDRYSSLDRLLHRVSFATAAVQAELADLEDLIYRKALAAIPSRRPVFITALPRAGTTLLLQLASALEGFASHCYRDMPFVLLPLVWHSLSRGFHQTSAPSERAHGDGMLVSLDSPEAFEEMVWKAKCPEHYLPDRVVPWTSGGEPEVAAAFTSHMKKIIRLRQRSPDAVPRYLSKNNGNIARIACLLDYWPDAAIVVPVREPVQHAASLLRQHGRFLDIHARDGFAREYMKGIGHFDFGANLRPIDFDGWLAAARHTDPRTIGFWLEYWAAAYGHLLSHPMAALRVVPYDAFCAHPDAGVRWLAEALDLGGNDLNRLEAQRDEIRVPPVHRVDLTDVAPALLAQTEDIYQSVLRRSDLGGIARNG